MSDTGLGKLTIQLDKISEAVESGQFLKDAGMFVQSAAKLNAPAFSGYLRDNIFVDYTEDEDGKTAEVYTSVSYAPYVELGTGPKGAMEHEGISPEVTPAYTMHPWWIHESQVDKEVAEMYHWFYIDTPDGRFYKCSGQPALPFMYPALKDNENEVLDIIRDGINKVMRKAAK